MAVGLLPMAACSDDDAVDPYTLNYCYVYQPYSTFAQLEYKANGQFLIDIDDPVSLMPVRLTKPAPADLTIQVSIDESLVEEYNKANGTDYEFLTGCSILNPTLKIKAGEYISTKAVQQDILVPNPDDENQAPEPSTETVYVQDSIKVSFGDNHNENFQTGHPNLILPIVITSVNNSGVTISKSSRIFLTFSSDYKANMISFEYLTTKYIDDAVDNWQNVYKDVNLTSFFNCKWNADDAITITAKVNNDLINAYNEANATNYLPMTGCSVTTSTINIPEGANNADLQVKLGDYTGVVNGDEYLVPIEFTVTSGEGAELDSDVAYILVQYIPLQLTCYINTAPYSVTAITKGADWTCTYTENDGVQQDYSAILNSTSYSNKTLNPGGVIEADLGQEYSADLFFVRFGAYYYNSASLVNVETSLDGTTWTSWGDADFGNWGYSNSAYIEFSKQAKFRYIRFTGGAQYYSPGSSYYYPRIRHLQFYTK